MLNPLSSPANVLRVNPGPRPVADVASVPPAVSFGFATTTCPGSAGNVHILDGVRYDPRRQVAMAGGVPAAMSGLRGTHYDTEHDGLSFPDKD